MRGVGNPPRRHRLSAFDSAAPGGILAAMPEHAMNYVEFDAPVELTLAQWRRTRGETASRRRPALRALFGF